MRRNHCKGDVAWYVPSQRKPVAFSTAATRNLLIALAKESKATIRELFDFVNYDIEAKAVLSIYIQHGYGDILAKEWFS